MKKNLCQASVRELIMCEAIITFPHASYGWFDSDQRRCDSFPSLAQKLVCQWSGVPMAKAYVGTLLGSYQSGVPMMGVVDLAQYSGAPAMVCHAGIWYSTWHSTLRAARASEKIFARFWPPTLLGWIRRTMPTRVGYSRALPQGVFGQSHRLAQRAYVETVDVDITDGKLVIKFTPQVENPETDGIEAIPAKG